MKIIKKKQIDNLLIRDKRTLKYIEVTYEGGTIVQYKNSEHINWKNNVIKATVVFEENVLEYAGFNERDYDTEGPILVLRNKIKIRPRKIKCIQ